MKEIVLGLPPELADALDHLAGRDEAAICDILRDALRKDLHRRKHARSERIAKEIAPVKDVLGPEIEASVDWYDLQTRLQQHGYRIVRSGGGLSLQDGKGHHICNASDLGHSHAQLTRRFGRPIPRSATTYALAS